MFKTYKGQKKKKKRFSLIKDGHLEILKMILNVIG